MKSDILLHHQSNANISQTRRIVSRFRFFTILIVSLFLGLSVLPYAVCAEDKTYVGDGVGLQTAQSWFVSSSYKSLFPGTPFTPLSADNNITINYDSTAIGITNPDHVAGGLSQLADVTRNSVVLLDGRIERDLSGGWSESGTASDNHVSVSGGSVGRYLYGGYSIYGDAVDNDVTISGGSVGNHIYGGYSSRGDASDNTVIVNGGSIGNNIFGGWGGWGNASGNATIISGVAVNFVYGGYSNLSDAFSNTVSASNVASAVYIYGGYAETLSAVNNIVEVDNSKSLYVYGGYSASSYAEGNVVTISNNSYISAGVFGGYSRTGATSSATDNIVTISAGSAVGHAVGGYSLGDATGNTITISDSSVTGNVIGGQSFRGNATDNVVTISGNVALATSTLYGGYTDSSTGNAFTGNTLNFKSSGITAGGVDNFEFYNFYLPDGTAANDTMLSVASAVDLSGTTVEIFLQGDTSLQVGNSVALIDSTGGVSAAPLNTSSTAAMGAFITYDFDLYTDANSLWVQLTAINGLPQSNILTDSRLAPLAFLNQGADLIASLEYPEVSGDSRYNAFAIIGGGSSTYDTGGGAEVDVDGFSVLAGVMWNAPVNKNSLIVSAFFEAGWGDYDTYRDFGGGDVVRGGGDTDYYGVGLHMRYKWDSDTTGGLYAEASLRFGRNKSDFYTNDLSSVSDFSYDSSSNYYGAHVGLGYVWQLSGKTRLEASSKYLWTRLGSDEVTASSGDRISFDSLSSSRWRTGFRIYHDYGNANAVTLYYGAAYEYEFDGDADGRLGGLSLDGISLSGSSGIGELGVIFRPSKDNDRLTMQLGVQGYVGAREGISGMLKLQYAF